MYWPTARKWTRRPIVTPKIAITPRKVRIVIHSGQDLRANVLYLWKGKNGSNQMVDILNLPVSPSTHTTQFIIYALGHYISWKLRNHKHLKENRPNTHSSNKSYLSTMLAAGDTAMSKIDRASVLMLLRINFFALVIYLNQTL